MSSDLTVIIPVADAETTVTTAVRSTLRNLRQGDRVLVYNDASTDGTAKRLQALATDHRVVIIAEARRVGVATALNVLLSETRTKYVARMDGDDIVLPGRFERQMREVRTGADVTFTARINFGPSWRSYRPQLPVAISPRLLPWLLMKSNPVPHSSMLGVTSVLNSTGGYRQSVAEDYDLWLRTAAEGVRISSSAIPGIAYRMHPHQVTRSPEWIDRLARDPFVIESFNRLASTLGGPSDAWASRATRGFQAFLSAGVRRLPTRDRFAATLKGVRL